MISAIVQFSKKGLEVAPNKTDLNLHMDKGLFGSSQLSLAKKQVKSRSLSFKYILKNAFEISADNMKGVSLMQSSTFKM